MLKIELMVPSEMPMQLLAESFRYFYERDPWNEYLRCPKCSPPGDFGAAGRYEDPLLASCSVCSTPLERYWSNERVEEYFSTAVAKPNFGGVFGKNAEGEVVAWVWGYAVSAVDELADLPRGDDAGYIDVIGVLPEYRNYSAQVIKEGQALCREVYGYEYFVTRTHRRAKYVQKVIGLFGYKFLRESVDPEKEFWIYDRNGIVMG
jgi:ribosomal protein S18 acetylase RimI-like enzyme